MPNIQFEEPRYTQSASTERGPGGVSGMVIRYGLARDEAGAQKVMLAILALCVVLIFILWTYSSSPAVVVPPPPTP